MKTINEQEIQDIMKKAPNLTREQIVSGLKDKGYIVQESQPATPSTPSAAPAPAPKKPGISDNTKNVLKNVASKAGASIFVGPALGQILGPMLASKEGRGQLSQAGGMVAGSTAQLLTKPFVSFRAGITGDNRPVNLPIAGEVRPFETPLSPATQYITQATKKSTPEELQAAGTIARKQVEEAAGTNIGTALELAGGPIAKGLGRIAKTPLTKIATKLYQSALKPTEEALKSGVVETALKERVWLTQGGVEKAADKIDEMEAALGKVIEEGKAAGTKISTQGMQEFVDPIRKWFETVDIAASKGAQEYIDTTIKNFQKKYGKNIPIEEAQKLKVNTMRMLRNAYGELSNVQKETQKQMARFLKEGIVDKVPVAGDINARLKSLYALDESLSKASKRIGNLNLLGLGTKLGAAAGGKAGAVMGIVADLMDKAAIKSGAAIGLNELANLAAPGMPIPISAILNFALRRGVPRTQEEPSQ